METNIFYLTDILFSWLLAQIWLWTTEPTGSLTALGFSLALLSSMVSLPCRWMGGYFSKATVPFHPDSVQSGPQSANTANLLEAPGPGLQESPHPFQPRSAYKTVFLWNPLHYHTVVEISAFSPRLWVCESRGSISFNLVFPLPNIVVHNIVNELTLNKLDLHVNIFAVLQHS